ncbi:MAG TPA: BMP family ABC transporter substrate-binding protein [Phototrophicaceae bacterium]|nr:BMP family ABC transporter substrate-binding protein [Phototrophicaceae bacterium]
MGRKLFSVLMILALLAVIPLAVNAQDATETPEASMSATSIDKICLVTDVGKINDGTFNQFAYEGFSKAATDFGLDSTYIETQAQTDYANNINTCLSEGYQAIVTVGFLISDATHAAAAANPNVYFIGVDQDFSGNPLPNLVGIQYREDQAGFLVGAMAALMSKSGTVAGVYGINVPAVVRYRNGFEQGAKYVNPNIKTLGVYIDSFSAPDRGATAAEQFIGEGADVIFGAGGPTGDGGIKYAASKGVLVIGVDQDEYGTTFGNGSTSGAQYLITSAMKRVDVGVYNMIQALVNGTGWLGGGNYILSLENQGIDFAPAHDAAVPQDVEDKVNAIKADLLSGAISTGVDPTTGNLIGAPATEVVVETAEPAAAATPAATAAS